MLERKDVQVHGIGASRNKTMNRRSSRSLASSCIDGIQNGYEEGIDCGGLCALRCDDQPCIRDADCKSNFCYGYWGRYCRSQYLTVSSVSRQEIILSAPTCSDQVRNNGETGIDCGGPCTMKCDQAVCAIAADCKSGVCGSNNRCASMHSKPADFTLIRT